jgi:hypothetical protein
MAGFSNIPEGYQKKGTAIIGTGSAVGSLNIATNTAIPLFVSTNFNDSDSIIRLSNTQIQLKAGKKYKLSGHLSFTQASLTGSIFRFYNRTATEFFGALAQLTPAIDTSNNTMVSLVEAYISPAVDTTIELQMIGGSNITDLWIGSKVVVEEVEALLSETLGRTRFTEAVTFDKSITAPLTTYSTTELDTGKKWHDGKTIYRRCFVGSITPVGGTSGTGTLATLTTGVETIINAEGQTIRKDGTRHAVNSTDVTVSSNAIYSNGGTMYIWKYWTTSADYEMVGWNVSVEYTKA